MVYLAAAKGGRAMELYQLKSFVEIARTGNLTEAAAQLNMSQPATSAQLKALGQIQRNPFGLD
jgi:hypothetical protein